DPVRRRDVAGWFPPARRHPGRDRVAAYSESSIRVFNLFTIFPDEMTAGLNAGDLIGIGRPRSISIEVWGGGRPH
ncbi:hypothetical protein, partial [Modestobacter muralis]|uniref:hypothetical protein n=1 Tax=Modestobacter muralis TaxID=1608614 RepID=UPI001B8C2FAA